MGVGMGEARKGGDWGPAQFIASGDLTTLRELSFCETIPEPTRLQGPGFPVKAGLHLLSAFFFPVLSF